MDITCSAEPCPIVLNSTCVFYEGDNLIYTGINNNDNLQTALQKIDQKFQDAGLGYIFSNGIEQLVPGGAVMLGGALNKNTTIGGLYNLAFAGTLEASALITTGGSSTDFVKGDGSLDSTNYQPAGNYISNLTGDVIANGPGSVAATLATVFGAPGTYGNSGSVPSITVDGKGRITNVTPIPINYPAQSLSFVGDVEGAGFTGSPVTLTLDTVNTDIYGSNNFLKFAVNGKGLITSATPVSGGDITTALGYVPVDDAIELTINGVAHDLTANRDWEVGTVTTVGVTVGTGISASVSNPNTNPVINIINTAPDQTVNLNAGFGISISGSYPNFTITNDYPDLPNEGVTSVSAGNLSPLFTTSVTDPTTTPALSFALSSAAANTVFAGPDGGAGAPTYRALVAADLPSLAYISSISTTAPLATTGGLTPTLSISQANASTDGYLSSTDWNTFNNKEDALGYTPVPDTRQLNINGVDYDLTADRCWSVGTVTSITASAPLTGGTITGSGSVGITQASGGTDGYLSATDWSTFNGKQPAGSYITDLTGDATASGPGSACLTLASVNLSTGTFGSSTQVPVITVNNKGLVTCVTTDTISGSLEFVGDVTGVGSTGTCTTLTLATVNNDVYTSETLLNIAVNGKGLITSANPTTAGDICSILGYSPEDVANKSTATSLGVSNTLYPTQLAVKTYVDSATAGGIILQGSWDADTNTPDISGTTTTGWAWRVDVAGTTNLGGINDWQVGDLAVKSATGWVKIDNTENVTSVFGRFGTVIATTGDYLTCQVTECGDLYYTDARVRAAVGHTAPLTYCSTTGVFGISQSNATTDGYLSSVDWNTFNDKQPLISCGTIGQYYRGDKTFQTLDTLAVPENTNLYFTDGRARSAICASSGVAYNPSTGLITNSCPDQIVSLTGGGTTSIAGTYPNFCITSNDCFTGTVTSVAVSGTNIGVTGSPITTCGTIGLSLSAANVCSALGFSPYNSTNPAGYTTCTGTVTNVAACTSTTGVSITGSPITSSGTLGINVSTASSVCTGLLTAADWNTFNSHTGCTGTVTSVGLTSSTAGVSIACSPVTSSGTISLNITTASSLCTGLLTASDWNSFNSRTSCTGTVTCVNATGTNISVTGGPITTSGTIGISLSGANVCSALGYTPYNASNPNGYTTCIGTVTSAGIVATNINVCNSPVTTSGNICLNLTGANVCSALGFSPAPSSALSAYLPLAGGTMSGILCSTYNTATGIGNNSFNTAKTVLGNYHIQNGGGTSGNNFQAAITFQGGTSSEAQAGIYVSNNNSSGTAMGFATTDSYATGPQLFMTATNTGVVNFPRANPTVQGNQILNAGNYNSYSPTLTGGGASGTWGINVTGTAGSETLNTVTSRGNTTSNAVTVGLFIAQGPGGNYNENIRLPGSTAVISFNTSGATGAGSYNIVSQTNFQIRNAGGSQVFIMDQSGNLTMSGSMRAPIFYDSENTGFYLDPNGTSNLSQLTTNTRAKWNMPRWWMSREDYTSDQNYWTGTNGWGTSGGTWANAWRGGFSGWDIWGTGTDHPQGGGYVHAQGIVSGQHLATSDGSSGYGWMMVGAGDATPNRYWLRGKWGGTTSGWVEMITTGNIGSQSVSNANTVGGYSVSVAGNANTIPTRNSSGYLIPENWIQLNGIYGLYSPTNNAHLRPNNASYGSWLMTGSRNGWQGIEFDSGGAGNITLMLHVDSNTVGFHNNSYGWQIRWANGTLFCGKNSYGGNDATVWDSSNAPRASNSLLMYYQGFTLNADTMDANSTGFTYSVNAPYTGPIVRFSETGYSLQLNAAYGGSGNLIAFRTRNGDSGTWNPWREFITTGNVGNQSVSYANNAGNVSSISGAVNGAYTWTGINYFETNNGGQAVNNSNSAKLQAFSSSNNSAFMSFHRGGHYAVNFGLDNDNVMRIGGWSAGANRWQLDLGSGNMTVAGDLTAYSDARVKTNIKTIENALDKVLGLRGVSYNRIDSDDKKTKIGVIAQETLPIVPEVVNQDNDGMYNVSYGNFGGLFIEAFKEQQKQIEHLKSIIDGLTK